MEPNTEQSVDERVVGELARRLEAHFLLDEAAAGHRLEYMTPAQAGGFLKLSPKALEHLRANGGGPVWHKYSGRCRYHINDLRAWAASHRGAE